MAAVTVKRKNIERLIARCESLVSGKAQFKGKEWKLSKYVAALCEQIKELEKYRSVDQELLHSYHQRASILQEVVRNSSQMKPAGAATLHSARDDSPMDSLDVHRTSTGGNPLLMRSLSQREAQARDELFSKSTDDPSNDLRHRHVGGGGEVEAAMERHRKVQEDIAEDMISIARSLRHNSLAAKEIILGDSKVLERTNVQADQNIEGVEKQTDRLKEHNRGCPWGTILLLVLVFTVFIAMIMFIRIVPKPS